MRRGHLGAAVWCALVALVAPPPARGITVVKREDRVYEGTCDASAAVALSPKVFVVGNDEDQRLLTYEVGRPAPLHDDKDDDWTTPLALDADHPEADIEAATRVGDVVYWITSHGRNSEGKERPNRRRFFATRVTNDETPRLRPFGKPYKNLLQDITGTQSLAGFDLRAASGQAPEANGGLNIEALSARPAGGLWIGFRNPIPEKKALLVLLANPAAVADGKPAEIGTHVQLDLQDRGLRSLEYVEGLERYLCVAGPYDDAGSFALYAWSGEATDGPTAVAGIDFGDLHPEALFELGKRDGAVVVEILSDDGDRKIDGKACKKLPAEKQRFRAVELVLHD